MVLPYLPSEHITPIFDRLSNKAQTEPLCQLVHYIDDRWIRGTLWSVEKWSIFNEAVHMNNDVEGWHGLLNRHAKKGNLSFYVMTALLYEQSRLTDLQVRLISDAKLQRRQRRKYRQLQGQLFTQWQKYVDGLISARQLLWKCSHLTGPASH